MKKIISIVSVIIFIFTSCTKDNYDAPNVLLTGSITYNGQALAFKQGEVTFRLYEPGWELSASTYINVSVAHDGTYSANVFSGKTYEIELTDNVGPWQNISERITVDVKGNTQKDIAVTPYFNIVNPTFSVTGGRATASFSLEKLIAGSTADKVGLYLAANVLAADLGNASRSVEVAVSVDDSGNLSVLGTPDNGTVSLNGNTITIVTELTDALKKESYIFGRVGVKPTATDALMYSQAANITVN